MTMPTESLEKRFSDPVAVATRWADALDRLASAELAWIVTVRPDGRPHATPVTDPEVLRPVADLFRTRWDGRWVLESADGGLASLAAPDVHVVVYEVTPTKARAHAKGEPFGQTVYRFTAPPTPARALTQEGIR